MICLTLPHAAIFVTTVEWMESWMNVGIDVIYLFLSLQTISSDNTVLNTDLLKHQRALLQILLCLQGIS